MTDDEARAWVKQRYPDSYERLCTLGALVRAEAANQNLVAPSTLTSMWSRHIVDSAQLDIVAPRTDGTWVDVGTGAGFPGLVIACIRDTPITLVEPRRRRAEFLRHAADKLGLSNVRVEPRKVEHVVAPSPVTVISARAVSSLSHLFEATEHLCDNHPTYVLPKGASGVAEVATTQSAWHGVFHVEQSVTDAASVIVVASGVTRACTASR